MKMMKKHTFRRILSCVMVMVLLAGFSAVFSGCNKDGGVDLNDLNNMRYEGLQGAAYMQALERDRLFAAVDAFGSVYDAMYKNQNSSSGTKVDMAVNIGDDLLNLVEQQALDGAMDLSFLSKLNVTMESGMDGQLSKSQMVLSMNGQKLVTMNYLLDMANYVAYVGFPELNSTYLKLDAGMAGANAVDMQTLYSLMEQALPNKEEMTALVKRYLELAINEFKNVEQTTITLEENNLKQECTQLTLKIYEEDFTRISKAVLTAAKDDAQIKKILVDYVSAMAKMSGENVNADEIYAEFQKEMENALKELNNMEAFDTESYIEIITYVDQNHNVIGRKLGISDEGTLFYYYTVTENGVFATKVGVDSLKLYVHGVGTVNNGMTTGEYQVVVSDVKILTVKLENASQESGVVTLTLTETAEKLLGLYALPFKNLSLQMKYSASTEELNILSEGKLLLGISFQTSATNGPDISVPTKVVDVMDETAFERWQATMDLTQLMFNLQMAGLSNNLLNP